MLRSSVSCVVSTLSGVQASPVCCSCRRSSCATRIWRSPTDSPGNSVGRWSGPFGRSAACFPVCPVCEQVGLLTEGLHLQESNKTSGLFTHLYILYSTCILYAPTHQPSFGHPIMYVLLQGWSQVYMTSMRSLFMSYSFDHQNGGELFLQQ